MKIFNLEPKIKVLCVIYFMVAQSSMMARATSDGFLLQYFEPESIPQMVMAAAGLSILLALLTTYLCSRFQAYGAMKLAIGGLAVAMLGVVAAVSLSGSSNKAVFVVAYMVCEVVVILPMVLFWGMAMGVLNPKESKKWFGMIGAAGTCGCILAGYTVSLASKSELVNELSLGLVTGVLMIVLMILLSKADVFTIRDTKLDATDNQTASIFRKLAVMISSRQSVMMTWLVVFSAMVLCLIDINFKFLVRKDYAGSDLYDFFGQFYTYSSVAQLLLQLMIVRTILTRGGVFAAISILPGLLLLTAIAALLLNRQDAVYVGKFITQVVFFTIEYVGLQMLYLSVSKELRGQMNSAIDGLTRPATIAAISLLVTSTFGFWQEDAVIRLNLIIIVLSCCWLFVAWLNYRQYLSSLLCMLNTRATEFAQETKLKMSTLFDSQLRDSLSKVNAVEACFLGDWIVDMNKKGWVDEFRAMLAKEDESLKIRAIRYLSEFGEKADRESIAEMTRKGSTKLRLESLRNLAIHSKSDELRFLEPLLDDDEPSIRCSSAAGLLNSSDSSIGKRAESIFNEFLNSENVDKRFQAVKSVCIIHKEDSEGIISQLLNDQSDAVKVEAIRSIDEPNLNSTFERLTKLMTEESLKSEVANCFKKIGRPAAELIEKSLGAMSYVDVPKSYFSLVQLLIEGNEQRRSATIEKFIGQVTVETERTQLSLQYFSAISNMQPSRKLKGFARKELSDYLEQAEFYRENLSQLPFIPKNEPMRMALDFHIQLRVDVLLKLLSILEPKIDYRKLFKVSAKGGANAEAEATEVLKGVVGSTLSDRLIALAKDIQKPIVNPAGVDYFFETFSRTDSRWILAGLLLTLSKEDYPSHRMFVQTCLKNEDSVVKETALEIFIAYENQRNAVKKQCTTLINDSCQGIALMAKQALVAF
jgi:HEAT repeat protein